MLHTDLSDLSWGCDDLPSVVYGDTLQGIRTEIRVQQIFLTDGETFSEIRQAYAAFCVFPDSAQPQKDLRTLGLAAASGKDFQELSDLPSDQSGPLSSVGENAFSFSVQLDQQPKGSICVGKGGGSISGDEHMSAALPDCWRGILYLNRQPAGSLTLEREVTDP